MSGGLYRLARPAELLQDGRQSATAATVCRGARRWLRAQGYASLPEMPLPSGRRADVAALGPDGRLLIVEVKSSIADLRADLKWREYRAHCDALYFAIPEGLPPDVMPGDAGLLVTDGYDAALLRAPPEHRLAGTTRRAMLLRFATLSAERLHRLHDPEGWG